MKKTFIKSVFAATLGLALAASCSSAKDKDSHKCAGKNVDASKKEVNKCAAEKTSKATKDAKKAKSATKARRNIEK